jgi:hypothetical protein
MKRVALYLLALWPVLAQVPGGLPCTPQTGRCTVNANRGTYAIDLGCFDSPDCVTGIECEQADYTYDLCTCTIITVGFTDYCGLGLSRHPGSHSTPDRQRNAIARALSCQRTHAAYQRALMPSIRLHQSVLPTIKRLNAGLTWYMHQIAYN